MRPSPRPSISATGLPTRKRTPTSGTLPTGYSPAPSSTGSTPASPVAIRAARTACRSAPRRAAWRSSTASSSSSLPRASTSTPRPTPTPAGRRRHTRKPLRGSERSARSLCLARGAGHFFERLLEEMAAFLQVVVGNGERREKTDHVRVHAAGENHEPASARSLHQSLGELGVGVIGAPVLHQLDGYHGAERAHLADAGEARLQPLQTRAHEAPDLGGTLEEPLLTDHLQHRESRGAPERRAGIGPAESARSGRVHDLGLADHGRQRHPSGDALGDGDEIRLDAGVLDREHAPGAAEAALDLVG